MKAFHRSVCVLSVAWTMFGSAGPAWAQQDEARAAARVAAQQGLAAYNEGRFSQAVDYLERAESVFHAPTHLLYIARAYEKLGKLVNARETYLKLTQEQLPAGSPKPFVSAKADGTKELAALEPRLAHVTVVLQGAQGQNLRVTADGALLPTALLGIARPTDPGSHTYHATADGMQSQPATILAKEGARETVSITLERIPGAIPSEPKPPSAASAAAASPGATGAPTANTFGGDNGPKSGGGGTGLRTAGWITVGLGVVGLGIGSYFLATGLGKSNDADALYSEKCPGDACPEADIKSMDDDAKQKKILGGVVMGVGGAAVITGITMLIVHSASGSSAAGPRVTPWVGLTSAGLRGTF